LKVFVIAATNQNLFKHVLCYYTTIGVSDFRFFCRANAIFFAVCIVM
jgi:hypothetical protein